MKTENKKQTNSTSFAKNFLNFKALRTRGFYLPNRLQVLNSYDSAGNGRRALNWDVSDASPTSAALSGLNILRMRSRHAIRNDAYACSAIDKLVSNTIGTGITPKPKHKDAQVRIDLQNLWDDWIEQSDSDGIYDFYGLQSLICRTMYESGECFVRFKYAPLENNLIGPLQLQVLEPEFIPYEKNDYAPNGNLIKAGIEFNKQGKRVAYWVYQRHPCEFELVENGENNLIRIPADEILHIYEPTRAGQLRGVPILANVLTRLKSLDEFDDAVLFRQEVANLFAGFIHKPAPEDNGIDSITGLEQEYDYDFSPMVGLEPGTMQELLPGEEVNFSSPPDAGNNYPDFMRQQLLAISAGVGIPFEVLTGDLRSVNDRVIRVVLNEFHRRIEQRQFNVFIQQLCQPVRQRWLDLAVLSGAVSLPSYENITQRREYLRTRWVPQGWSYIQPVQDVQAKKMEVRCGFTSRSEVALRQGYDAELIDAENSEDIKRADNFGLIYETDPRLDAGLFNPPAQKDIGAKDEN